MLEVRIKPKGRPSESISRSRLRCRSRRLPWRAFMTDILSKEMDLLRS
jgi:hypothetical protein